MPEIPDIVAYVGAVRRHFVGKTLSSVTMRSISSLKTVEPQLCSLVGMRLLDCQHIGKRIFLGWEEDVFVVIHLMRAGRLRLRKRTAVVPKKRGVAGFYFSDALLLLTEEGSERRASIHVACGWESAMALHPGGIDPMSCTQKEFALALKQGGHRVKTVLCLQSLVAGIGNAYSDEILHAAKISPFLQVKKMTKEQMTALWVATGEVLAKFIAAIDAEVGDGFPEKVTAFRKDMAVHGKFSLPCGVCGCAIQRIVYKDKQCNYCPDCQTGGRVLKDRSLSRLLKDSFPTSSSDL